jgi:hypothetical protein
MSQSKPGVVVSLDAGGSISAYRVVYVSGDHAITLYGATHTTSIVGITQDGGAAGTSIPVVISGTAKVEINDSVTAGQLLVPAIAGTISGRVVGVTVATATAGTPYVGICLDTVSGASCTGAVVEVVLFGGNLTHLI